MEVLQLRSEIATQKHINKSLAPPAAASNTLPSNASAMLHIVTLKLKDFIWWREPEQPQIVTNKAVPGGR